MGTHLLDRLPLKSGEMLFLVYHAFPMELDLIQQIRNVKRTALEGVPADMDPSDPSYRLQLFGRDEAGCRIIIDLAPNEETAA